MTIDGAIAHAEEVSATTKCKECAEEHRQLAEWLKELKEKRQAIKDTRAEIDEKTEIHPDGELYIKNIDVKRIIDRHIVKGESNDG